MPLETAREHRQQAELLRLSAELAAKTAMIAELQAANAELHERAEQWRADYARVVEWSLGTQAGMMTYIDRLERESIAEQLLLHCSLPPKRMPPHICAGCRNEIAAEAVAWAAGDGWICVECMQRG